MFAKGLNLLEQPPKTIASDDAAFKAIQPMILQVAPSSIKSDLEQIFTFDNGLFTALSKVGWTVSKLPRSELKTLGTTGPKLKPASDKVVAYLDSTCGLKLPMP